MALFLGMYIMVQSALCKFANIDVFLKYVCWIFCEKEESWPLCSVFLLLAKWVEDIYKSYTKVL